MNRRVHCWPHAGLSLLSLRRTCSLGLLIGFVVLAGLQQLETDAFSMTTEAQNATVLAALRRESTWTLLALFTLPVCIYAAAQTGQRWRAGDRDWLGPRAISRMRVIASTYLGLWIAGALIALAIFALAEVSAGSSNPALRRLRSLVIPSTSLIENDAQLRFQIANSRGDLRSGRSVRLELHAAPGSGPTALVKFTCRRIDTEASSENETILSGRANIDLVLPEGNGNLEFTLSKVGTGCGVVSLPGGLALFQIENNPQAGSLALLARVLLWLGAWLPIAIGLGAWMSALTATALCLALQLPVWVLASSNSLPFASPLSRLLPGADLYNSLTLLGDGLVPPHPSPQIILGWLGCACCGLLLATLGLRRGESR